MYINRFIVFIQKLLFCNHLNSTNEDNFPPLQPPEPVPSVAPKTSNQKPDATSKQPKPIIPATTKKPETGDANTKKPAPVSNQNGVAQQQPPAPPRKNLVQPPAGGAKPLEIMLLHPPPVANMRAGIYSLMPFYSTSTNTTTTTTKSSGNVNGGIFVDQADPNCMYFVQSETVLSKIKMGDTGRKVFAIGGEWYQFWKFTCFIHGFKVVANLHTMYISFFNLYLVYYNLYSVLYNLNNLMVYHWFEYKDVV